MRRTEVQAQHGRTRTFGGPLLPFVGWPASEAGSGGLTRPPAATSMLIEHGFHKSSCICTSPWCEVPRNGMQPTAPWTTSSPNLFIKRAQRTQIQRTRFRCNEMRWCLCSHPTRPLDVQGAWIMDNLFLLLHYSFNSPHHSTQQKLFLLPTNALCNPSKTFHSPQPNK